MQRYERSIFGVKGNVLGRLFPIEKYVKQVFGRVPRTNIFCLTRSWYPPVVSKHTRGHSPLVALVIRYAGWSNYYRHCPSYDLGDNRVENPQFDFCGMCIVANF